MMIILADCSGGGGGGGRSSSHTVSGTVSGLLGTVVLQDNGTDTLSLDADGSFTFPAALADGVAYRVTVQTQPANQTCSVVNSIGIISGKNVANVDVTCSDTTYTVGGMVSGLSGTVVLQDNGTDILALGTAGTFTFSEALADMASYQVTVQTQPANQTCSIVYGTGVISGTNITNVIITCSEFTYTVGGMVSGLSGMVVLQNNGADIVTIGANGSFAFPILYADGTIYNVTVQTHPTNQICSVANNTGTIPSANVTNVTVACEAALGWDAPISDIDGSIIADVAGYRLYYGTASGMYSGSIDVGNSTRLAMAALSATLPPGTYYAAVAAYDAAGVESPLSNEITVTIN